MSPIEKALAELQAAIIENKKSEIRTEFTDERLKVYQDVERMLKKYLLLEKHGGGNDAEGVNQINQQK